MIPSPFFYGKNGISYLKKKLKRHLTPNKMLNHSKAPDNYKCSLRFTKSCSKKKAASYLSKKKSSVFVNLYSSRMHVQFQDLGPSKSLRDTYHTYARTWPKMLSRHSIERLLSFSLRPTRKIHHQHYSIKKVPKDDQTFNILLILE